MLPFFRKSETYPDRTFPDQHGYDGPIRLNCTDRGYPLRGPIMDILTSTGLDFNPDINAGDVNGVAPIVDIFQDGVRQFAANQYDLSRCNIITSSHVARVIHENGHATGVELENGEIINVTKEVILASGAVRSPQVLLLSGIGPADELAKHSIPQKAELPVGQGLHDHIGVAFAFKLRNPENGYALGSPKFISPEFFKGPIMDYITSMSVPDADIEKASAADGQTYQVGTPRTDLEILSVYGAVLDFGSYAPFPMDGTRICFDAVCLSPSSRGRVTLASTKAQDNPNVDPNFYTTEHDRAIIRHAVRTVIKMAASEAGQKVLEGGETPPGDLAAITLDSSDADIDDRLKKCCHSFNHMAGTCAMGRVVDGDCKVKGFDNLRVVDASIMPRPISGHIQAGVYALAERAADIIIRQA